MKEKEEEGREREGEKTVGVDAASGSDQCWKFTWLLNIFCLARPTHWYYCFLGVTGKRCSDIEWRSEVGRECG